MNEVEKRITFGLILLHLAPGTLQMVVRVGLWPMLAPAGVPSAMISSFAAMVSTVPFILVYLYWTAKRRRSEGGVTGLEAITPYTVRIPVVKFLMVWLAIVVTAFAALVLNGAIAPFLAQHVFGWIPPWLEPHALESWPVLASLILPALLVQLVVDGFVVPATEELYFRGALMNRLRKLGMLAPMLSAALFSIQHFWQPENYLLIFVVAALWSYAVWRLRNIYIAIAVHCALNTIGSLLAIGAYLA